ncbi:D-alanyl-D-alanine carboxypeptidase/D-alanyl-D-alanine endopeptidase [Bifidobacterium choloepi]|uniref:D-alanyl-D-alanine carboxypeptidase/D-alanyl-D-alanine-endopeptidase n=1 Tax=Bifidobacterium choloepi TaxID=2614131 RepID=A0A6I5MY65_9BIFI|nr:D-alanyl-D-alanine carboxypeptidase/D-alanyl-D-alanine-endopeptidase [Bifidobacterium choloepi]NEG69548.1 D-alanyl-D-alanine carboxypeptidase/D-alanyl-D-alanine-endopeptidase [Bifidobacterium choloepi]
MRHLRRRRTVTVVVSAAVTALLCAGYVVADIAGVAPGILTTDPVTIHALEAPLTSIQAADIAGDADTSKAIDKTAAQQLVDTLTSTDGVGDDMSVAIAQADGTIVASSDTDTAREPASTMKTLTALAAASVLDMGTTLSTSTYLVNSGAAHTLILKGEGDMLLGTGESDPNHVNGRAGLTTLAEDTAEALKAEGVTSVSLSYDDSLFGTDRYPANIAENNEGYYYYTGVSSMAIDGGRQWDGNAPSDPDVFEAYPVLSQTTAADTASTFATLLEKQGITVSGTVSTGTVPANSTPIASVQSAPLSSIMMFMLRHSDNTLAEEFGRLLAIAVGDDNSPTGATTAVTDELDKLGLSTDGLVMADCSGLSPGSRVTVRTLVEAQVENLKVGNAVAAAEGLSIPGLVGTAVDRLDSSSAAGLMRVKTGSLGTVTSMTGNVSRKNGGVAAFSVIVNNPTDYTAAKDAINTFIVGVTKL